MIYVYKCETCNTIQEIDHPMKDCEKPQTHNCGTRMYRVIQPTTHVGDKVKPGSKEVNAYREHSQELNNYRKRGKVRGRG